MLIIEVYNYELSRAPKSLDFFLEKRLLLIGVHRSQFVHAKPKTWTMMETEPTTCHLLLLGGECSTYKATMLLSILPEPDRYFNPNMVKMTISLTLIIVD